MLRQIPSKEAAVAELGSSVVWLSGRNLALAGGELILFVEVDGAPSWSGATSRLRTSTGAHCVLEVAIAWRREWIQVPTRLFLGCANAWYDLGRVHVGSYRIEADETTREVDVSWEEPLPPKVWLALGGYPDWQGSIDGAEACFTGANPDFLAAVDRADRAEVFVTRREGDSLTLLLNPTWALVMHLRFDGDSGCHAATPGAVGTTRYQLSNGQVDEHALEEGVAREDALRALHAYLATGDLPAWLTWVDG